MKFAHMSDCHIGGWNEEKLKQLCMEAFRRAVNICIEENVDFVIIAGDLFNTAIPQIELIRDTAEELKRLKDSNINVYLVPGSHDFSPSGKTILDVFEKAGLVKNVFKIDNNRLLFTVDSKTNVKITGMLGLRGSLEILRFEELNKEELEKEEGYKIFVLHSGITELMPKNLFFTALPLERLPKNFNYYASGHVHYVFTKEINENSVIAYPGPLFPNNFSELEELKCGGFYIIDGKDIKRKEIKLKEVSAIKIDADNKSPSEVEDELKKINEVKDKIALIRVEGRLREGNPSDINFNLNNLQDAFVALRNTTGLVSVEYEETEAKEDVNEIEAKVIEENKELIKDFKIKDIIGLLGVLNKEKEEGENVTDFENRLKEDIKKWLGIGGLFDEA